MKSLLTLAAALALGGAPALATETTTPSTSVPSTSVSSTSVSSTSVPSTSVSSTSVSSTSVPSTSVSSTSVSSTSVPTTSTTSTTQPPGSFTRTPGFYKNRPDVTQSILDAAGGIEVCGLTIDNTSVGSASSALEAMCGPNGGDKKTGLIRALTAAALTQAAGGATFGGFDLCNMLCATGASDDELSACTKITAAFNESADNLPAPFGGGSADSGPCQEAADSACRLSDPATCNP
jgi:hypothetical protein